MELLYESEHDNEILKTLDELKKKIFIAKKLYYKNYKFYKEKFPECYEIVSCLLKTILKFDSDDSNLKFDIHEELSLIWPLYVKISKNIIKKCHEKKNL